MDALTKLNVLGLALSAVLLAMACVKADRVRAWRAGINPSAESCPTPPSSSHASSSWRWPASASARPSRTSASWDGMSWDDSEPTSAVRQATDDLDGYRFTADDSGTPLCFDDYESLYRIAVGTRKGEC